MKASYKEYNLNDSVERVDEILTTSDAVFEEVDTIPSRDRLTFTNGFYVMCSSLCIDIRGSSALPAKYKRPSLARIYRSYISEMVAIMNGDAHCSEVNIVGDSVWGVFDTQYTSGINSVFCTAARLASMTRILNYRFKKKNGYEPITTGIGMDYGRALMLKAGYKGSSVNDVVWMGEVVNQATKLCGHGNRTFNDKQMMVSKVFRDNLTEENQKLIEMNYNRDCYHGNVVNLAMDGWCNENCES